MAHDGDQPVSPLDAETLRKGVVHVAAEVLGLGIEHMVCCVKMEGRAPCVISEGVDQGVVPELLRDMATEVQRKLDDGGGPDDDSEGAGPA